MLNEKFVTTRSPRRMRRQGLRGWLLSLPAIVVMIALTVIPLVSVLVGAISEAGWEKLQALLATPSFGQMLGNTVIWVVAGTVGTLVIGVAAALALEHKAVRVSSVWRSLLLIPWITPIVVAATAWKWFYSRDYGMLNSLLTQTGLVDEPISWLTDTRIALYAVTMVHVWATFSFVMLMVSAGLKAVPSELYEAARMDGANAIRSFWSITVPSLRDILFIVTLIVTVWTMNSFLPVWIMTKGGPAGATNILPVQLYQYFQLGDLPAIYVLAAVQLVFSMAVAALYVRRTRKGEA